MSASSVDLAVIRNYIEWEKAIRGGASTEGLHRLLVEEHRPKPSVDQALAAVARLEMRL